MNKLRLSFVIGTIMIFALTTTIQAAPLQRYWVCTYTQGSGSGCTGGGAKLSCFFEWAESSPCSKYRYWYDGGGGIPAEANCCDGTETVTKGLDISEGVLAYPDQDFNVINVQCANENVHPVLDFDNLLPVSWSAYRMALTLSGGYVVLELFEVDSTATDFFLDDLAFPDLTISIAIEDILELCEEEPTISKSLSYTVIEHKKPVIIKTDRLDFSIAKGNNDEDYVKVNFLNENVVKNNHVTFRIYTIDGKEIANAISVNNETFELPIKYGELPKGIVIFSASYNSDGIKDTITVKYLKE